MEKLHTPINKTWLFYGVLALIVMIPLLRPGYILSMDMVFAPRIPAPTVVDNVYIFNWLIHALNWILPSQIIQKLLMIGIMYWSGLGMHRLAQQYHKVSYYYFAGLLYVINPYTYERWMAGHYLLLAGYAVLPWLLRALLVFIKRPSVRQDINLGLLFVLMGLLSVHMLGISILATFIVVSVQLVYSVKRRTYFKKLLRYGSVAALVFVTGSAYWLFGVVRGTSPLQNSVSAIQQSHLEAFSTAAHPHVGLLPNVAGMYGFWAERYSGFVLPNTNALSIVFLVCLMGLVVYGFLEVLKKNRSRAVTLLILAVAGFIVASGIHAPLWGGVNKWVLLHVPFMRGFRDSQKFTVLLVVAYSLLASVGVRRLAGTSKKLTYALLLLPFGLTPFMLFGFNGQLKPVQYPASWYSFNDTLHKDPGGYKILFLPWHQYSSFDFTYNVIATPAERFFGPAVIASDDAELGQVGRQKTNSVNDFVEQKILAESTDPTMGAKLASQHIKYVLLAHGPDWQNYTYLANQPQLKLISQDDSLLVFLNKEYK